MLGPTFMNIAGAIRRNFKSQRSKARAGPSNAGASYCYKGMPNTLADRIPRYGQQINRSHTHAPNSRTIHSHEYGD